MREPITLPRNPSKSFIAANPQLYAPKAKMPRSFEALQEQPGSPLERRFSELWDRLDPEHEFRLEREYRFAAPRRWRFDFCHLQSRVAIELEGGIHQVGRHQRPAGFVADCSKYFEATLAGYTVFRLPSAHITEEIVTRIYGFIRRR